MIPHSTELIWWPWINNEQWKTSCLILSSLSRTGVSVCMSMYICITPFWIILNYITSFWIILKDYYRILDYWLYLKGWYINVCHNYFINHLPLDFSKWQIKKNSKTKTQNLSYLLHLIWSLYHHINVFLSR